MIWRLMSVSNIAFAPEGEGGGGGQEGGQPQGGGQEGGQPQGGQEGSQPEGGQAPTKPDWMPDKLFGDGSQFLKEDGTLDYEGMGKALSESYRQAENKIFTRKDDLKKEVHEELEQERRQNVPESPDKYDVSIPEGTLPEGTEVNIDENDPLIQQFRQQAHDLGLTQEQFSQLWQTYVQGQMEQLPDAEKEMEKLGDYGRQRVERVENWMTKHLSENAQEQMKRLAVTAETVQLFEEMMELTGEPKFQTTQDGTPQQDITREDLEKLQQSQEYLQGDPATVRKVRQGYQKLAQQRARGG